MANTRHNRPASPSLSRLSVPRICLIPQASPPQVPLQPCQQHILGVTNTLSGDDYHEPRTPWKRLVFDGHGARKYTGVSWQTSQAEHRVGARGSTWLCFFNKVMSLQFGPGVSNGSIKIREAWSCFCEHRRGERVHPLVAMASLLLCLGTSTLKGKGARPTRHLAHHLSHHIKCCPDSNPFLSQPGSPGA